VHPSGHEPIRIVSEKLLARLDLGRPTALVATPREAAAVIIARHNIESGIARRVQLAAPSPGLPAWAFNIEWYRPNGRVALPWRRPEPAAAESWSPQAALVREMVQVGIGRPSTWAGHAERLLARGLVDTFLQLTAKGEAALAQASRGLQDVPVGAALEDAFEAATAPQQPMPVRVTAALRLAAGSDDAFAQLVASIPEAPMLAPEVVEAPNEGRDFDEEFEEPASAFRP